MSFYFVLWLLWFLYCIIELWFLNSNFNSLFEILSIKDFFVDSIMWSYISPISSLISNSSLSRSILKHLQSSYYLICLLFLFHHFHPCLYDLFHQLLQLIYAQQNTNHFFCLKQNIILLFLPLNSFFIFEPTDCCLLIIRSYWLIPSLALNPIASAIPYVSSIIVTVNSSSKNILQGW